MAQIKLILIPYDSGAYETRHGLAPKAFIASSLVQKLESDGHHVHIQWLQNSAPFKTEISTTFNLLNAVSTAVTQAQSNGEFPLVIAGNCNSSVGVVAGLPKNNLTVLWFDGNADFNTPETTESGFLDGMSVAMMTGKCWQQMLNKIPGYQAVDESRIILAGVRDIDKLEEVALSNSDLYLISDITNYDQKKLSARLNSDQQHSTVHIHIDLDVFNPNEIPANIYQPAGGPLVNDVRKMIKHILLSNNLAGLTIASYDPTIDPDGVTVQATIELISSILANI